ncbi:methyltransferase [Hwanghaeella grinnelliae]|uniref:Methyltransferase n=1 Tax=Hwanghaeella grinnelliae TaxID=2500179 RepID=A0A437QYB3_9PROT|nr:methyltransferase domain-containing protein [Hwanghaeella grinnelliae]RVU39508.1 methyltransferase [Hwanghaeella grinnelliae]
MDIKEEDILGASIKTHWYYVSKGLAVRAMIGDQPVGQTLDVGAGSGVFTRQLIDCGLSSGGVCVDPYYPREHTESYGGSEISFVHTVDSVPQRLVLMMDVLEHVDDDVGMLREYVDKMTSGSRVLITVPAFQFLWSGHDVFLEHKRRYTLQQISDVAAAAGLQVSQQRYFFGLLFPVAALLRLFDRLRVAAGQVEAKSHLKAASGFTNSGLIRIHDVERKTLFPINRLCGLSAFCLATKP